MLARQLPNYAALRRGEVQFVPAGADRVVRYWRVLGAERLCVTVNLGDEWRTPAAHLAPVELMYRHGPVGSGHNALPPFGTTIEREI